jgi:hypothetical protein
MLSDNELDRLRFLFFDAGVSITHDGDEDAKLCWADTLLDPTPDNIRTLLVELRGTMWHGRVLNALVEIGYAGAADVLIDVPLPLDRAGDRRWQLRRELARIVAVMDVERLQQLVYWARSVAQ